MVAVLTWASHRPESPGSILGPPAIAGDSTGGLIAVMATNQVMSTGARLRPILLVCPNTDLTLSQPSVALKESGWARPWPVS
ncbi:alpha/beta hydrolase fold domain-containing protein [Paeniglutamicibacter antarcticus]|uniref:Alpha/beta hydrolase fold domain-containing protein n=1 Tax=Arthrobacter terrae TaxID=2935737 RepID=A0A931G440_9MICC|nr:alpha/beta hydrolase fold domain-containing protein [Arthrobacter terrae]